MKNMARSKICSVLIFAFVFAESDAYVTSDGGRIWALLAAGSNGFMNYRHQADVCHAYHILLKNGIPHENIIVMMFDDIAHNAENPWKGVIINAPNGTNVYKRVRKDYIGNDVTPENFLKILTGDEEGMKGIGSGRVIKSGPQDHLFINFVDHGGPGLLAFPNSELFASDLEKAFVKMVDTKKFSKMVFYIEACESGSMFEHILPDNENIFVVTAAKPHESSFAWCYYDPLNNFLGDVFSVNWMHDVQQMNLAQVSLQDVFEEVRSETDTSHVEEYGDMDLRSLKVADFLGFGKSYSPPTQLSTDGCDLLFRVPSRHVPLAILQRKFELAKNKEEKEKIKYEIHHMLKKRRALDKIVIRILMEASGNDKKQTLILGKLKHSLTRANMYCYKRLVTAFSQRCFKLSKNPYALGRLYYFLNICEEQKISEDDVVTAMQKVCLNDKNMITGVI